MGHFWQLLLCPHHDQQLTGKTKQAFANGFLAVPSFGYSTLVSVATASDADIAQLRSGIG